MAVVVIKIALVDIVTHRPIANKTVITVTGISTVIIGANSVIVTVVLHCDTFIYIITKGAVAIKADFAGAVKDIWYDHVAVGVVVAVVDAK